jgi:hypothetical protein
MNVNKPNTLQKYMLDPLSTIIKLAVLGKKEIGCKISISNNQIYIQENGIFQGVARYYLGLTKNDIHYLSTPIEFACKRYLTLEKIKLIPNISLIFTCAQQGLNNLMITYNAFPIIVHCLKYYHTIIDNYLHLLSCEQNQTKPKNINNSLIACMPMDILNKNMHNKNKFSNKKKDNKYQTHIDDIDTKNQSDDNDKININDNSDKINDNVDNSDKINITDNDMNDKNINNETNKSFEAELLELYDINKLNKFDLIWEKSKVQIIIEMINYLSNEKSAYEYSGCIETFMIPIDKEICKIIYENENETSE